MAGVAGASVLARALETALSLRRILLLKTLVGSRSIWLSAADRRHAGLLFLQTLDDALGVLVFLVLWHGLYVSAPNRDAEAAFLGPKGSDFHQIESAMLMPHLTTQAASRFAEIKNSRHPGRAGLLEPSYYNRASEGSGMATNLSTVLKHIHQLLAPPGGDQTDGELLAHFVATRDEESFAAMVRRHGPMVLAVCRRLLRHVQDAEDCFQATFLVLARKAATVKNRESVGSWLYAVAYRIALEAKAVHARRRAQERQLHHDMPHPEVLPPESQDWRPWLDRELNHLPQKYRAAIVACDLEGRSRKEAARLLGIAEGTLSSRLARGRNLLAKRLAPYGLSLSGAALAAAICDSAALAQVPAALIAATAKAALLVAAGNITAVSASSAILMKGVLKSMFLTKLKLTIGAVMVVTALGASGLVYRASGQSDIEVEIVKRSDGKPKSELERLRHENELLKVNLEVVLEKVRAQEAELRTLRGKGKDSEEVKRLYTLYRRAIQEAKLNRQEEMQKKADSADRELKKLRSEEELKKSAAKLDAAKSDLFMWEERAIWSDRMSRPGKQYVTVSQAEADEARRRSAEARFRAALLDVAEAALKVLREAPDTETQRKAAEALDNALKQLKDVQTKKPDSGKK
jgi:RNA polymerase sigma factor (sigma-70 family)